MEDSLSRSEGEWLIRPDRSEIRWITTSRVLFDFFRKTFESAWGTTPWFIGDWIIEIDWLTIHISKNTYIWFEFDDWEILQMYDEKVSENVGLIMEKWDLIFDRLESFSHRRQTLREVNMISNEAKRNVVWLLGEWDVETSSILPNLLDVHEFDRVMSKKEFFDLFYEAAQKLGVESEDEWDYTTLCVWWIELSMWLDNWSLRVNWVADEYFVDRDELLTTEVSEETLEENDGELWKAISREFDSVAKSRWIK